MALDIPWLCFLRHGVGVLETERQTTACRYSRPCEVVNRPIHQESENFQGADCEVFHDCQSSQVHDSHCKETWARFSHSDAGAVP